MPPTKHNILCEGKSVADVVGSHDDFIGRPNPVRRDDLKLDPEIEIVREPEPQYVLVMEKSVALDTYGQWKWINKATQKFIRYDQGTLIRLLIIWLIINTFFHLLVVEVSCVLFLTQPVCIVPNQDTQNLYLQADGKRCIGKFT